MNRSEELAKLLGIEHYKHICPHCNKEFNKHYTDKHYCQWCGCYSWNFEGTDKNMVKVYPDFTLPENFVRLLELKLIYEYGDFEEQTDDEYKTVMFQIYQSGYATPETINDFIDILLDCIEQKYIMVQELKELAQATKWTY